MRRRILYVQYANPGAYPPLEHSSRLLARAGWTVVCLGVGVPGVERLVFPPTPGVRVRRLGVVPEGRARRAHFGAFAAWTLAWALRFRPDWVYASDALAAPAALLAGALPGVRVLYHEHDTPGPAGGGRGEALVARARRALARRAALCVLPNAERAARFRAEVAPAAEVLTVWNCPRREEVRPARPPLDGRTLTALYHGSIVPARLPASVVAALARVPAGVRLRVVGYEPAGHAGYAGALAAAARQQGVADRLEVLPPVPRPALLQSAARADVGLAFMPAASADPNHRAMTGASNKAFDYLACGLALLVSALPDWRAFAVEPGYGLACDPEDPDAVAGALRWLLEHPAETRRMGEQGRQRVLADWSYEHQFAPVLARLEGRPAPAPRAAVGVEA